MKTTYFDMNFVGIDISIYRSWAMVIQRGTRPTRNKKRHQHHGQHDPDKGSLSTRENMHAEETKNPVIHSWEWEWVKR
jgi:hypothetical protein